MPCTDWVEKLTASHQDDLSPIDRHALNAHLAACHACNHVYATYRSLEKSLRTSRGARPIPVFSYQPLQRKPFSQTLSLSFPLSFCLLLFTTLSSLYFRLSWSGLYQKMYAWMLAVVAGIPRRISYVRSDAHFLYAIRSDSGYCLWRQKRYQRHEFVSNCSLRCSALTPIGSGVALAAALDFCRYAVQA